MRTVLERAGVEFLNDVGVKLQADALEIESLAKRRLADEYDAAQERGEVRTRADNQHIPEENKPTVAEIGLTSKVIHESRLFSVANLTGFVHVLAVDAEIGGRGRDVLFWNIPFALSAVPLNLSRLLRQIVFVGEPALGEAFDLKRVGLKVVGRANHDVAGILAARYPRRAIGLSAALGWLARLIGIPTTRIGRQRKLGRWLGMR